MQRLSVILAEPGPTGRMHRSLVNDPARPRPGARADTATAGPRIMSRGTVAAQAGRSHCDGAS